MHAFVVDDREEMFSPIPRGVIPTPCKGHQLTPEVDTLRKDETGDPTEQNSLWSSHIIRTHTLCVGMRAEIIGELQSLKTILVAEIQSTREALTRADSKLAPSRSLAGMPRSQTSTAKPIEIDDIVPHSADSSPSDGSFCLSPRADLCRTLQARASVASVVSSRRTPLTRIVERPSLKIENILGRIRTSSGASATELNGTDMIHEKTGSDSIAESDSPQFRSASYRDSATLGTSSRSRTLRSNMSRKSRETHVTHETHDEMHEIDHGNDPNGKLFGKCEPAFIKQIVRRDQLGDAAFNIKSLYYETGLCQRLARHHLFEHTTIGIIVLNAIWIAVATDQKDATSFIDPLLIPDIVFFTYFTLEVLIRFMAIEHKLACFRDPWFLFDAGLVFLYGFDPFMVLLIVSMSGGGKHNMPTEILRLCRLARLFRLNRLLRHFKELMIMIKGMITALATVGYTICLLGLATFVFAIIIRNLVPADSPTQRVYFSSVPHTIHHLLIYGTFMDSLASFILQVKSDSIPCLMVAWTYVAISALLMMNMLIGIVCEVIAAVATEEKEIAIIDKVKREFSELIERFNDSDDGAISWESFAGIVTTPECQLACQHIDVDLDALIDMAEDVFFPHGETDVNQVTNTVTYAQFIALLLDLRGANVASVKDMMAIGKRLNTRFLEVKGLLEAIDQKMEQFLLKQDECWKP